MKLYGWFGLLLLIFSEYCLFHKIEPFVTWFYCFAWWSYILLADNLLLKLRGSSLIVGRLREFLGMIPLSIFIWLLFEAYNFSIRNWEYSVAPPHSWQRWVGYMAAFSTVLPGIFITSDIFEFLLFRNAGPAASESGPVERKSSVESRAARVSKRAQSLRMFVTVTLGIAMSIAPLIWPRYCFPAVWLGPIFALDPLLEKMGIHSLSSDINSGNRRRVWSLMAGGLLCGFLWEFWNFWAGSKWLYHVPFFGKWKIFEMPVLGFLGFPPFALECWILYHLLCALPRKMESLPARAGWWILLGILSGVIFHEIDQRSVLRFTEIASHSFAYRSNN
jgi:hypothetical protein